MESDTLIRRDCYRFMKIFATNPRAKNWHYLNLHNVKQHLKPTYSNSRYIAFCPYCKNPIVIMIKHSHSAKSCWSIYARHLVRSRNSFLKINDDTEKHCLLRASNVSFVPCLTKSFDCNEALINKYNLQKTLSFYTGIYFSKKLITYCLRKGKDFVFLRHTDKYNFPFALLIATKAICLNYRKVASPNIINAVRKNSTYFDVFEDNQISYCSSKKATLWMSFRLLSQDRKNNWPRMQILIKEIHAREAHVIYSFNVYCKLSRNLVQQDFRKE